MNKKITISIEVLPIVAAVKGQCDFYTDHFDMTESEKMTINAVSMITGNIDRIQSMMSDEILKVGKDETILAAQIDSIHEKYDQQFDAAIAAMASAVESLKTWQNVNDWAKYQLINSISGAAKAAYEMIKEAKKG